jgi:vacuolar-type H+-ATPase subunit E/Vma4
MNEATEIEKKSLEAHVELCAERYNALEDRLALMDGKINSLTDMIKEVKESLSKMAEKNNDRLIAWGVGIITALGASTVYLLTHYVWK